VSWSRLSIVTLACAATSCTASYPTAPDPAVMAMFIYQPAAGRLDIGTSRAFRAYAVDSDGVYEEVTFKSQWSSSDPSIARQVTAGGALTFVGVAAGGTQLTARYGGVQATMVLAVSDPALQAYPRLVISNGAPPRVGTSGQASVFRETGRNGGRTNVTNLAFFTSSNPEVATVTEGGFVRAVGVGNALISVDVQGLTEWYWLSIPPS
jgi:hypothetical protein